MSILSCTHLSKSFGIQDVLQDIKVSVAHGEKIALVGPNGAGKTTLLRILIGLEHPTTGTVDRMKTIRIGYLPQQVESIRDETPLQLCQSVYQELQEMQARLRHLETLLADPEQGQEAMEKYGRLLHTFEHAGGYEYPVAIDTVLSGLGLDQVHRHRPLNQLSGGQRTRAILARLLLEKPNILVLDEPTNHLDLQAIEWLEQYLQEWPEAILLISHDRYFLDQIVDKVWELNGGRLETYPGNYSKYVNLRDERAARQATEWQEQQALIAQTKDYIRRYKAGQRSKQAHGRERRLDRLERLERPRESQTIQLSLESDLRSGELVLVTQDLVVGYDRPLVTVPDLELRRLHRAALIGPNGVGKTTLIKTILEHLPPLQGEARLGASLQIGYLSQTREELDNARTVVQEVERAKELPLGEMRNFLARFLFTDDDVFKLIGDLSGGERCRVALAKLTLIGANFLVLDEPTNQLDIPSQEILQEVFQQFIGTILLVSHDRYLIDALATQIWVIDDQKLQIYQGDYQAYLAQRQKEKIEARERARQIQAQPRRSKSPAEATRSRPRTIEQVEHEIFGLEQRLQEVGQALTEANQQEQFDRVHVLGVEYTQIQDQLEQLMAEWETLGEAGE